MFSCFVSKLPTAGFPFGDYRFSKDECYLNGMRKSVSDVVCNFLLILSSHNTDKHEQFHEVIEQFCVQLKQCLIKTKSLPPSASGVAMEFSLLYNMLYASCLGTGRCQHHHTSFLSSHARTVLLSLKRAQLVIGAGEKTDSGSQLRAEEHPLRDIPSVLSSLLTTLRTLNNRELGEPVGLLACMWSLLTLLEEGASSPLSWLSPLQDWVEAEDRVVLKHGFLLISPSPSSLMADQASSGGVVRSLASLLMAVSCFHRHQWDECKQQASTVTHPQWTSLATLLTARAMLSGGHSLEAVGVLHTALNSDQDTASPSVVSSIYQLLAASYSAQGLPHLDVEMLRHSLQIQPESTAALCRLAKLFQSLQQGPAEIECLKTLVKAAEKEHSGRETKQLYPRLLADLLQQVVGSGQSVTVAQAVYHLASRSSQLHRYEEASEAYMKLIKIYEKKRDCQAKREQDTEMSVPDLLTVCVQAAQVMLEVPQHRQCVQLCDKVLGAIASSPHPLSQLHGVHCHTLGGTGESVTAGNESMTISLGDCSASETPFVSKVGLDKGRKRNLSSAGDDEFVVEEEQKTEWKDEENRVLMLVCKAECLLMEGDHSTAVSILNRAFQRLMEYWQPIQGSVFGPSWQSLNSWSIPKRPRFSINQEPNYEPQQQTPAGKTEAEEAWSQLSAQVCLYLCDALCRCGEQGQALRFARLAAQVKLEEESQYYVTSILSQLGRVPDRGQSWLHHRRLPHNTGSVRLQSAIQQRQEMIRELSKGSDAAPTQRLGAVTETQKLQLDLLCLKSLAESRLKKSC